MALDSYHHGVRVVEVNEGTRTIRTIATAADRPGRSCGRCRCGHLPAQHPGHHHRRTKAVGKAGIQGTLAKALQAIADTVNTITIVVRVAKGATDAATNTNVIGTACRMAPSPASRPGNVPALPPASPRASSARRGFDTLPVATELAAVAVKAARLRLYRLRLQHTDRSAGLSPELPASAKSCWCTVTSKSGIPPPMPRPPSGQPPKPWPCGPRSTKKWAGTRPFPTSRSLAWKG